MVVERSISVTTHGRYLVDSPAGGVPRPLLVGFHGYAEGAEAQRARLLSIPAAREWLVASVQGLHRFYRGRSNDVVAGWMTRQDRDLAIADNAAYAAAVITQLEREFATDGGVVLAGFSQGVAMAFRTAASSPVQPAGVIALGGDVPPELDRRALGRIPAVLLGRGTRDEWYGAGMFAADTRRLGEAGVRVIAFEFDGGHEWTEPFATAASTFLEECRSWKSD